MSFRRLPVARQGALRNFAVGLREIPQLNRRAHEKTPNRPTFCLAPELLKTICVWS